MSFFISECFCERVENNIKHAQNNLVRRKQLINCCYLKFIICIAKLQNHLLGLSTSVFTAFVFHSNDFG
jgi:hypothetical protein